MKGGLTKREREIGIRSKLLLYAAEHRAHLFCLREHQNLKAGSCTLETRSLQTIAACALPFPCSTLAALRLTGLIDKEATPSHEASLENTKLA